MLRQALLQTALSALFVTTLNLNAVPFKGKEKSFSKSGDSREGVLFYLQRSINASAILYVLNTNEKGEINELEPIRIYWKNFATDSSTQPLNYIQRKYAYGLEIKTIKEKEIFCVNFVSYKKKTIYLIKSPADSKYRAFCQISGKLAVLNRIFVQIDGGSFWLPGIRFIEISGSNTADGQTISERVKP